MLTASRIRVGAALGALALVSTLVIRTSEAAFTARTTNEGNAFEAASIELGDTATDALFRIGFNSGDLLPGATVENCIPLTYDGGDAYPDTPVRLYSPSAAVGDLASWLDVEVEVGSGGSFDDCSGFVADSSIFAGDLVGTATAWETRSDYASGADVWTPAPGDEARTVKVTVDFAAEADDSAQGATATDLDFVFEVRG